MVAVQAGLIGPEADGITPRQNPLDVERHMLWLRYGRSGIVKGLVPSVVPGQMQLSFTAGSAVVCERDGSQVELDRAYPVYSPSTAVVQFGAASASARNDAVVAAAVDVEDGAQGTGALGVGGHLVVVPGVSGVTAVRTNAQIAAYLGRGGFHRLYDVPIAAGSTQINLAGATFAGFNLSDNSDWTSWSPQFDLGSFGGFNSIGTGQRQGFYTRIGGMIHAEFRFQLAGAFSITNGTFVLLLPVPAYVWGGSQLAGTIGEWTARDDSTLNHWSGSLAVGTGSTSVVFAGGWDGTSPKKRIDHTDPIVWATGDVLSGVLDYRAA